jgi:hypothetical protein
MLVVLPTVVKTVSNKILSVDNEISSDSLYTGSFLQEKRKTAIREKMTTDGIKIRFIIKPIGKKRKYKMSRIIRIIFRIIAFARAKLINIQHMSVRRTRNRALIK